MQSAEYLAPSAVTAANAGGAYDRNIAGKGVSVSSPLRVQSARANVVAPVIYDRATVALTTKRRTIDLAPPERETNLEPGWPMPLASAPWLRLGVAPAFDADHMAAVCDTVGVFSIAVR